MSRDNMVYLDDILQCCDRIIRYTQGMAYGQFETDDKTVDAVVRNLEIIGEAVKNIPEAIKDKNTQIEWRKIAGLRDIVVHAYFNVSISIVWDVVTHQIPELKKQIDQIRE